MIYTDLTKKALKIAFDVHKEQKDKGGLPYIYHSFYLATLMADEYSICVALLHDVFEYSDYSFEYLTKEGFPNEIIKAVKLLTYDKNTSYLDYIYKIKTSKLATTVKVAELKHNSDLTRLSLVDESDIERQKVYKSALIILKDYKHN